MAESDKILPGAPYELTIDPSDMTPDAFWEQYGEKFDPEVFPRQSLDTVWQFSEANSADFERHNFDHAKETLWIAMDLVNYCEENGEEVDRVAVALAALSHDNGLGEDYAALGFDTEEEYATALCEKVARSLEPKLPENTIDKAKKAVQGTAPDAELSTIESKVIANADLQNVGEDYETSFLPVTKKLWEEYKQRFEKPGAMPNDILFIKASIAVLRKYIAKDLSLGAFDRRNWHAQAKQNIEQLDREFRKAVMLARRSPADILLTVLKTVIDYPQLKDNNDSDGNG
jgi:hypothetical protein